MKSKIKLALCQIAAKRENKTANLEKIEELTLKAKEAGSGFGDFSRDVPYRLRAASTKFTG